MIRRTENEHPCPEIAAAVKLTLSENKLRHFFQVSIIAYSLRVCNLGNYIS